jgi:hypothetical protein
VTSPLQTLLTLARLVAFMVLLYVGLGWLVERYGTRPDGKVRAFFQVVCSPVTRLVAGRLPPRTTPERVLRISFLATAAAWVGLVLLQELLRPGAGTH